MGTIANGKTSALVGSTAEDAVAGTRDDPMTDRIEDGRYERAVTESMRAEPVADRLYRIVREGTVYEGDLETGACVCADARYRGDQYICKHVIRAALVEAFANTVSTPLVAHVVGVAAATGCPFGVETLCDGPVGPRLPCPGCIDAVRSDGVDEWTVWQRVVSESRA